MAYVDLPDPALTDLLVEVCSFKVVAHDKRGNRRDNKRKLYSRGKMPVGLLDRSCRVLQAAGVVPEVFLADTSTSAKPGLMTAVVGVEPRDYQAEALLAAQLNDRGIFRVPTGGGKSLIGAMIIEARQRHALVIVPTIDLLYQYKDYLAVHLVADYSARMVMVGDHLIDNGRWHIGQLGDGVVDPQPVTVATIRTAAKVLGIAYESYEFAEYDDSDDTKVRAGELRGWVENIGTLIIDEAHILGARVVFEVANKIPATAKYGMSASPWRDDGADLMIEAATGPALFHADCKRLVDGGYLMAPEIIVYDTSTWWSSAAWGTVCKRCKKQWLTWTQRCECGCRTFRSQWMEAYKVEIVENQVRNERIAQIVNDLQNQGRITLVLVKQITHGRTLRDLIPGSVFLSGQNRGQDRHDVLDAMRTGRLHTIVATQIADMGLDIPNLSALVLAGGGKSSTRHLQRIGRVVRPFAGKSRPVVVDFCDAHIHPWFGRHEHERRRIEHEEWADLASWSTRG